MLVGIEVFSHAYSRGQVRDECVRGVRARMRPRTGTNVTACGLGRASEAVRMCSGPVMKDAGW